MSRRLVKRTIGDCEFVIQTMQQLQADLPELIRRAEHMARDGFPSSSMPEGGGSGPATSSTERTALSRPVADPVRDYTRQLISKIRELAEISAGADSLRRVIFEVESAERGRKSQIEFCENPACGVPCYNGRRAGRCDACYVYRRRKSKERPAELVNAS